jgi:hypothetical protein
VSLRRWISHHELDAGEREGLTTEEREELSRLRRENRILKQEERGLAKSHRLLRQGGRDSLNVFRFIDAERAHLPLALLWRRLRVSRSGYYAWRSPGRLRRELQRTPPSPPRFAKSIEGAGRPTALQESMPS